jgi:hypothetical protein
MYNASNHPARRRRHGDRPTEPLTFEDPAEPLVFEDPAPAAQVDQPASPTDEASQA